MRTWIEIGDVNALAHGAKWFRRVDASTYHVVELTNMDDVCDSDNEGHPRYVVELSEVDLNASADQRRGALRFIGSDESASVGPLELAEALHSYGAKAPLDSYVGNNGWRGVREMKRTSRTLVPGSEAHERAMERPVNRIGSTAREFQRGDVTSAIVRALEPGHPMEGTAKIMVKMMGGEG